MQETLDEEEVANEVGDQVATLKMTSAFIKALKNQVNTGTDGLTTFTSFVSAKVGQLTSSVHTLFDIGISALGLQGSVVDKISAYFNFLGSFDDQESNEFFIDTEDMCGTLPIYGATTATLALLDAIQFPSASTIGNAIVKLGTSLVLQGGIIGIIRKKVWSVIGGFARKTIRKAVNPQDVESCDKNMDFSFLQGVAPLLDSSFTVSNGLSQLPMTDPNIATDAVLKSWLQKHNNEWIAVATLGATIYVKPRVDQGLVYLGIKYHMYNYAAAHSILLACTGMGNTEEDIENAITTAGTCLQEIADDNEKECFTAFLETKKLVAAGILMLSPSGSALLNRYYTDEAFDGKITKMFSKYISNVPSVINNRMWAQEICYQHDALSGFSITTFVCRGLSQIAAQSVPGYSGFDFTLWIATTNILNPAYSIKTDSQNIQDFSDHLLLIAVVVIAVIVSVKLLKFSKHMKQLVFAAQRQADLAAFDESVSTKDAYALQRKATLLSKVCGISLPDVMSTAASNISASSRESAVTNDQLLEAINNIDPRLTEIVNSIQGNEDLINRVIKLIKG